MAEVGVGGINNSPGPPPSSLLGPWGVNRDWCSSPQVCSAAHQEASWMPLRETCLCGCSGCAQGWAQPHGGGDRADPSAGICLIAGGHCSQPPLTSNGGPPALLPNSFCQ